MRIRVLSHQYPLCAHLALRLKHILAETDRHILLLYIGLVPQIVVISGFGQHGRGIRAHNGANPPADYVDHLAYPFHIHYLRAVETGTLFVGLPFLPHGNRRDPAPGKQAMGTLFPQFVKPFLLQKLLAGFSQNVPQQSRLSVRSPQADLIFQHIPQSVQPNSPDHPLAVFFRQGINIMPRTGLPRLMAGKADKPKLRIRGDMGKEPRRFQQSRNAGSAFVGAGALGGRIMVCRYDQDVRLFVRGLPYGG